MESNCSFSFHLHEGHFFEKDAMHKMTWNLLFYSNYYGDLSNKGLALETFFSQTVKPEHGTRVS